MGHPYQTAPDRAFWKRAFFAGWATSSLVSGPPLIRRGERVASAGSCFAANLVPYLENAGFGYVRAETLPATFSDLATDNFSYSKFSAAYGNIYTVRQAVQLLQRALGQFKPVEDRWVIAADLIVDPFRPGLKYPALSDREYDALTTQHLSCVLAAIRAADVFVFTLGLTEAWLSAVDGAVFPACPGTVAGIFDPAHHAFHNYSVGEVIDDLSVFVGLLREISPRIRVVLTVSPVPLVATASEQHVLVATSYSKSVLRAAAGEIAQRTADVVYFPAYEIVTGPQAPAEFFEPDRREPSSAAIQAVMGAFLSRCETDVTQGSGTLIPGDGASTIASADQSSTMSPDPLGALSAVIAEAQCEEAAAGR